MAVQQMTRASGANLVEANGVRRVGLVVTALAIEAVLIVSVVLSTIGVSPDWHPTPGGIQAGGPVPAPTHGP
jgi:hypothetical protein